MPQHSCCGMRHSVVVLVLFVIIIVVVIISAVAFGTGYLVSPGPSRGGSGGSGEREVLYYVDPMNPSFRSPEPGTAP